jgi:hypothetical protein
VYVFRASGENAVGETDFSPEVNAMPMPSPSGLSGDPGYEHIDLWWDGVSLASGYRVYFSSDPFNVWAEMVDVRDTTATTLAGLENGLLYYIRVVAYDEFGNESEPSNPSAFGATPHGYGAVAGDAEDVPRAFGLAGNCPNPFNSATAIEYEIPASGGRVTLAVYDVRGRLVRTLVDQNVEIGRHRAFWDGTDDTRQRVPSGIYFYRLQTPQGVRQRKGVLVR